MNGVTAALLLTMAAGLCTGIGGALVLFKKKISSGFLAGSLGLSAGVMLFISLAELLPEAQKLMATCWSGKGGGAMALVAFFIGMGIITVIDFIVPGHENPHEASGLSLDGQTGMKRLGMMSAIAIAVHNFPEGVATFIGALNDPQTGAGITFAIALHNIPEGIAVAIPIYCATRKKGKAFLWAMLSGLSEPAGALLCYGAASLFGISLTGDGPAFPIVLAAVAGIMAYISLDELLPTAEKYGKHHVAIAGVVAGMAVMGASLLLI